MTPDKGFLSRSHVPGSNPQNEAGDICSEARALLRWRRRDDSGPSTPNGASNGFPNGEWSYLSVSIPER